MDGSSWFAVLSSGNTVEEAFDRARKQAIYNYGGDGYTGSIAEKDSVILITDDPGDVAARLCADGDGSWELALLECALATCDSMAVAIAMACALVVMMDTRIHNEWGPASALPAGPGMWLFFGWAHS